jgi:hypothetical protein
MANPFLLTPFNPERAKREVPEVFRRQQEASTEPLQK